MSLDPLVERWFLDRRGITRATLDAFGIYTEGRNMCIPYPGAIKKRWSPDKDNPFGLEKEERKFMWEPAGMASQIPFLPPGFDPKSKAVILLEGESDTMSCWQNAPPEARTAIVGISGSGSWKERYAEELFAEAKVVWVVLDNDDPYKDPDAKAAGDAAWKAIRATLGKKAKRATLPQGTNDVAEFFQTYDWGAFRVLLEKAREHKYNYPALDLRAPMPEYDWLVDNLIAKGDIILLSGDGGTGKSFLALDLAVAMATGREKWLGMAIQPGKVLFVDQEDPIVTIRKRIHALGMTDEGADNLRYLWYTGVRLDHEPERLYEDAEEYEPSLIVINTVSRVHFKNENSAEEMNPLMNGAVYPLARKLGATVLLIHHTNKEGGSRGSSALPDAVDLALLYKDETTKSGATTGRQLLIPSKLRSVTPWGNFLATEREGDIQQGEMVTIHGHREDDPF